MFKHLSLYTKVIIAYLVAGTILAAFGVIQLRSMQGFQESFADLAQADLRRVQVLSDIRNSEVEIRAQFAEYERDTLRGNTNELAQQKIELLTSVQKLEDHETQYQDLLADDILRLNKERVDNLHNAVTEFGETAKPLFQSLSPRMSAADFAAGNNSLSAEYSRLNQATVNLLAAEQLNTQTESNHAFTDIDRLARGAVILSFTSIGLAVIIAVLITIWISRPIARLRSGAERLANGDFSRPLNEDTNDAFGNLARTFNQMASRLRRSYQRLAFRQQQDEAILQGISDGLVALNEKGEIMLMNRVAREFIGVANASDAIGKNYLMSFPLYSADDRKREAPLTNEERPAFITLKTGEAQSGVYLFKKAEDQKYLLSVASSPVILSGKVVGAVVTLRDVTKEKEVDRMKTEFISLASHQLRTPLSAIKWFSEMLLSGDAGKLTQEQHDFVQNVSDSTERMIELVNALLNISRIESGRIMVVPQPTDLSELVTGITNDLQAKIAEKQQHLVISVHEGLPKINLDPRLIGQVYLNLLTNAIKYTPKKGEITVMISAKGDDIITQVTDNGVGIPKMQQGRMFEKFFRATNVTKEVTDGTGLGLYLTKAVIESSGGKIWFKSEEGKGTTFWFTIPMSGMKAKEGEVTLDA